MKLIQKQTELLEKLNAEDAREIVRLFDQMPEGEITYLICDMSPEYAAEAGELAEQVVALIAQWRNENAGGLRKALENFIASGDTLKEAIASATKAGWSGSGYSVELFADGDFHVLWDNQIGNLYQSKGVILGIPQMSSSDYAGDGSAGIDYGEAWDEALNFFAPMAEEMLREKLDAKLGGNNA